MSSDGCIDNLSVDNPELHRPSPMPLQRPTNHPTPANSADLLRASSPAPSVTSIKPHSPHLFSLVADDIEYEFELARIQSLESGEEVHDADFETNLVSFEDFKTNGAIVNDRNLVLRYRNK
jgi:hypothetical protein